MNEVETTKIIECGCMSEFQDKRYGKGRRLHNRCKKDNSMTGWRCTVCGVKKGA